MSVQLLSSRWVRLGAALAASILLDLTIDRWGVLREPPLIPIWLLDWVLGPGVYLAIYITNVHEGPTFEAIVWIVTTLILTGLLYPLSSIIVYAIRREHTK